MLTKDQRGHWLVENVEKMSRKERFEKLDL